MPSDDEPVIGDEGATVTIALDEFTEERVCAMFGKTLWPDIIGNYIFNYPA